MKAVLSRRPSGAMVVASVALVLAASGTAVAAGGLVNGNKLIKKGTLSGNRLRKHTITGRQINFKKLGQVPRARTADTATYATNATNAANANTVGGQAASAFAPASDFTRTGLVTAVAGAKTPLVSFGPFALTLNCVKGTGSNVRAEIDATSAEANSDGYGTAMTLTGQSYVVLITAASGATFLETNDNAANFFTPSGKTYIADLTVGQNYLGAQCYANALVSPS